mgnify:CR=1 FL=1
MHFRSLRLKEHVLNLQCKLSTCDNGLFFMHQKGELIGLLLIYVDDVLWGGTTEFSTNVISKLKLELEVGSEQSSAFKYIGLNITQAEDYSEVQWVG